MLPPGNAREHPTGVTVLGWGCLWTEIMSSQEEHSGWLCKEHKKYLLNGILLDQEG